MTIAPLHPWIETSPPDLITSLESKRWRSHLLSTISWIAIGAISLVVLTTSFFCGGAPTAARSLFLVIPVLLSPGLAFISSKFHQEVMKLDEILQKERRVAQYFETVKQWSEHQILTFLKDHHIQKIPSISPHTLLPLIARFEAQSRRSVEMKEIAEKQLQNQKIPDRNLRLMIRALAWNLLEQEAIPSALEAAFILEIFHNPYRNDLPKELFILHQKSFEERQFDRLYGPHEPYFSGRNNVALSFEEIIQDLSPDRLREMIFGGLRNVQFSREQNSR